MKTKFLILIIASLALFSSVTSFAKPHFDRDDESRGSGWKQRDFDRPDDDNRVRDRRMREERGGERWKQHRGQADYVMPQHYRGNGYKVDYKDNQLPRPKRNEQWYKINNDYILVNSEDNSIIQILGF